MNRILSFLIMLLIPLSFSFLFLFASSSSAEAEPTTLIIGEGTTEVVTGEEEGDVDIHGLYKTNTNACSKCHSTHSGMSAKLIKEQIQELTCYLCHDGRGSKYDSKNGKVVEPESGVITDSVSGGFNGTTSSHNLESSHSAQGGNGVSIQVVCTSCHNPHGSSNHRDLQTTVNSKTGIIVDATVSTSPLSKKEVVSYRSGITNFCISCHEDYNTYYQENLVNDPRYYRHPNETLLTGGKTRLEGYPKELTFTPTLYTTLPTQGVPSGAYPNPESKVVANTSGTFVVGDYYYLVTAGNAIGESHEGYIKKINVAASNSHVILKWADINNATKYYVYRAQKDSDQPGLAEFKLIADSEVIQNSFVYSEENGEDYIVFTDNNLPSGTKLPPGINSQGDNTSKVVCISCHFAHGTSKTDTSGSNSSGLKRLNNSGVCQNCHKR